MAKLIILLDGKLLREYNIHKDRVTIGRRPENDIHIDNLAVSGEHAILLTADGEAFLEDLNSTNGTVVNNVRIKKQVLQHNDVITLGKYQLRYFQEQSSLQSTQHDIAVHSPQMQTVEAEDPDETHAISIKKRIEAHVLPRLQRQSKELTADSLVNEEKPARLQILNGDHAGQSLLLDKTMTKLGQQDESLALITRRPHGYFITYLEGDKKPLVNDQPIGIQAHVLNNLDLIEVLGEKMEFRFD